MLLDLVSKLLHEAGPHEGWDTLPDRRRVRCSLDSRVDVVDAGGGDLGDELSCAGVQHVERLAALGVLPLAVDEQLARDLVGLPRDCHRGQ